MPLFHCRHVRVGEAELHGGPTGVTQEYGRSHTHAREITTDGSKLKRDSARNFCSQLPSPSAARPISNSTFYSRPETLFGRDDFGLRHPVTLTVDMDECMCRVSTFTTRKFQTAT